jgi:hypothetical protein
VGEHEANEPAEIRALPLYTPTFNDTTPATNVAAELRRIAVNGVPRDGGLRRNGLTDETSIAVAALANRALEALAEFGSGGLADWLIMRLANDPDDLFASIVQRRFADALVAAKLMTPAEHLDSGTLWQETDENAPARPVTRTKVGVPWAPRKPTDEVARMFTPRVSSPTER